MTPVGVFLIYPNEDKCYFVNTPNLRQVLLSYKHIESIRISSALR